MNGGVRPRDRPMSGKECLVKNFLATVHEQAGNGQKPLPSLPTEPKRSASSSDPFVAALKAAEECRAAKENDKAVLALERASQIRPSDPRPYFHMAMLRTASSDCEGACKAALRAIELSPGKHLGVLPSELKNGVAEVPKGIYPQIGLRAAVMACVVYFSSLTWVRSPPLILFLATLPRLVVSSYHGVVAPLLLP